MSVCGLNNSGRKVELVARVFATFESKTNVIAPSEEQKITTCDYQEMLSKYGLVDPISIKKPKELLI